MKAPVMRRLAAILFLCTSLIGAQAAHAVVPGTYRYTVAHPTHGEIGTYSNTIRQQGDQVTVDTRIDIAVKVAFVTVHRVEADRKEAWQNGRMVSYSSTTQRNGSTINVQGKAEGDKFVIQNGKGRVEAPADVFPTNAWSIDITKADTVMASETGRVYPARIESRGNQTIEVNGKQVPTKYFKVVADTTYELWFDQRNVLVKFTSLSDGDVVSFTLNGPAA